jgi:hypothetical protein
MTAAGGAADAVVVGKIDDKEAWTKWFKESCTELDDQTPMVASKSVKGRKLLHALLTKYHEKKELPEGTTTLDMEWIAAELKLAELLPYQGICGESYVAGVSIQLALLTVGSYLLSESVADVYNDGDRGNFEFLSIIPYWCCLAGALKLYRTRQLEYRETLESEVEDISMQITKLAGTDHFFACRAKSGMETVETKDLEELKKQMKAALLEVESAQ